MAQADTTRAGMTISRGVALKSDAHASGTRTAPGPDEAAAARELEPAQALEPATALELEPAALLRLLQLTSSVLPIGAFAYSQGLEGAIERGWIAGEAGLAAWLGGVGSHSLVGLDLPVLLRLHAAWLDGDPEQAWSLSELLLAQRESRELLEQDEHLGSALSGVLMNVGVAGAAHFRGRPGVSYAFAYALGAAHFGLSARAMAHAYAFAWSEQQVGAAARLLPLGHMASQRVLSELLSRIPGWIERAQAIPSERIGALTPALAMASAWHESQYSRLFRS
jgi:urease accessory protein